MKKSSLYGLLAGCVLLLGGVSLYSAAAVQSMRTALLDTQAQLAESEERRVASAYDLQKEIESIRGMDSRRLSPGRKAALPGL